MKVGKWKLGLPLALFAVAATIASWALSPHRRRVTP